MYLTVRESPDGNSCNLFEYPEITNFVQACRETIEFVGALNFDIWLVEPGYYETRPAIYGYCGCVGYETPEQRMERLRNRPNYPKNIETLNITFETTKEWYEANLEKIKGLKVTPGGRGQVHPHYSATKAVRTEKWGYYKKPCFDEIFAVFKKHFPEMSEDEFSRYGMCKSCEYGFNMDLVEKVEFRGEEGCLQSVEKKYDLDEIAENPTVKLSIIVSDLEENSEKLLQLLESLP